MEEDRSSGRRPNDTVSFHRLGPVSFYKPEEAEEAEEVAHERLQASRLSEQLYRQFPTSAGVTRVIVLENPETLDSPIRAKIRLIDLHRDDKSSVPYYTALSYA